MKDCLSLLSVSEYKKYERFIPRISAADRYWFLRADTDDLESHRNTSEVPVVYETNSDEGYLSYITWGECSYRLPIRPALRTNLRYDNYNNGDIRVFLDYPFIHIDTNFWIAEVPITVHEYDNYSGNYSSSSIRRYLCSIAGDLPIIQPSISKETGWMIDDDVFVLSEEEYIRYKEVIPPVPFSWYLRTPCKIYSHVFHDDSVDYGVKGVTCDRTDLRGRETEPYSVQEYGNSLCPKATRPALKTNFRIDQYRNGDIEIFYNFPFVHIGVNLWIAKIPISHGIGVGQYYQYESSNFRKGVLWWKKHREAVCKPRLNSVPVREL